MPKILYGMQVADAIDQFTLKQFSSSGRYSIRGIPTLSIIQMDEDDITFRKISAIQNTAEPLGIKTEVIRTKEDGTGIRSIIEDVCSTSNNSFAVVGDSRTRNNARMWTDDMSGHVAVCDLDAICYTTLKKFYAMHHPQYAPAVAIAVLALLRYYKIDFVKRPVVVLGRSILVGRAIAYLLSQFNATVSVVHSKTPRSVAYDLMWTQRNAIIITATGSEDMIAANGGDGNVIINVGIHKDANGEFCGDFDAATLSEYTHSSVVGGIDSIIPSIICAKMAMVSDQTIIEYIMSDEFLPAEDELKTRGKIISCIEHDMTSVGMSYTLNKEATSIEIEVNHNCKICIDATEDFPIPRVLSFAPGQRLLISYCTVSRRLYLVHADDAHTPDIHLTFTEFS